MDKFQELRNEMFRIYEEELSKTGNKEFSLDAAKKFLDEKNELLKLELAKRWIPGLTNELDFYIDNKKSLKLEITPPAIDRVFKADFKGVDPITGEKILIDVTTNLYPKFNRSIDDWAEIGKNFKFLDFKYRISPMTEDSLSPFLIPVDEEGHPGHFVFFLEKESEDMEKGGYHNLYGYGTLLFYDKFKNPSDILTKIDIKQIIIYNAQSYQEILNGWGDKTKMEQTIETLKERRFEVAKLSRNLIGISPSAMIEMGYVEKGLKDGGYLAPLITWLHPLPQIKRFFGDFLEPCEYLEGWI